MLSLQVSFLISTVYKLKMGLIFQSTGIAPPSKMELARGGAIGGLTTVYSFRKLLFPSYRIPQTVSPGHLSDFYTMKMGLSFLYSQLQSEEKSIAHPIAKIQAEYIDFLGTPCSGFLV